MRLLSLALSPANNNKKKLSNSSRTVGAEVVFCFEWRAAELWCCLQRLGYSSESETAGQSIGSSLRGWRAGWQPIWSVMCQRGWGGCRCRLVQPVSATGWQSKHCWRAEEVHALVHVWLAASSLVAHTQGLCFFVILTCKHTGEGVRTQRKEYTCSIHKLNLAMLHNNKKLNSKT